MIIRPLNILFQPETDKHTYICQFLERVKVFSLRTGSFTGAAVTVPA